MSVQDIRDAAIQFGYDSDRETLSEFCARQFNNAAQVDAVNKLLVRMVVAASNGGVQAIYQQPKFVSELSQPQNEPKTGLIVLGKETVLPDHSNIRLESYPDQDGNLFLSAKITPVVLPVVENFEPTPEGAIE